MVETCKVAPLLTENALLEVLPFGKQVECSGVDVNGAGAGKGCTEGK